MSIDSHRDAPSDTRRPRSALPCRPIVHAVITARSRLVEPTGGRADLLALTGQHPCSRGAQA